MLGHAKNTQIILFCRIYALFFNFMKEIPPKREGIAILIIYINTDENNIAVSLVLNIPRNSRENETRIPNSANGMLGITCTAK